MNINDVPDSVVPVTQDLRDIGNEIYNRQAELEEQYWVIEKRPSRFVLVNSREGQILIKDFLWRFTEEIGEFLDARKHIEHAHEELADALHFLAGITVVTGKRETFVGCTEMVQDADFHNAERSLEDVILYASMVGNTLKMKPWKQTDVLTDENKFDHFLGMLIISFFRLSIAYGLQPVDLFKLYWKKSEVNLFRQRSKY